MRSMTAPNPNLRAGICVGLGERRVSAMYFHEIWREVGGGIALSREALDLFFPSPAEAASRLFEDDWEEWGE